MQEVIEQPPVWASSVDDVLERLGSSREGLSSEEAQRRFADVGPNRLPPPQPTPWWKRVLAQFQDTLIYILLASAAAKAVLADWVDFTVILAVAVINAVIGLVQEGRAEKALAGIRTMLSVRADVRRDGGWIPVDADVLVPGDVVRLRAGDKVPADLRLVGASNLQAEESALTGESVPTTKDVAVVGVDAGVGDRSDMVFSGTLVTQGSGRGVVTATGRRTEVGKIQTLVEAVEPLETPLSRQLDAFGKMLALLIAVMAVVMVVVGRVAHDFAVPELVSATIGFAVAAVPEGLPALVTIILALGVQQMARQRAITRTLPAVETLGSVTTICSDKTGTLTRNEMTARTVVTRAGTYEVTGVGYAPDGVVRDAAKTVVTVADHADLDALVTVMARCNDAVVHEDGGTWTLVGVPTDGALRTLGLKAGFDPTGWRRVDVVPFDSQTKYMGTLDEDRDGVTMVFVKGAPDRVLDHCAHQRGADGTRQTLERRWWEEQIDALGAEGLRVLAAAVGTPRPGQGSLVDGDLQEGLEMVGLVGIVDPPRPEAVHAIAECRRAGITVKMITGDHAGTAMAIGREMGIVHGDGVGVLTGAELEAMSTAQLREVVRDVDVYARTSPEHKIRIVSALQHHGEVVAMTGDGVNDAPALTQADVGVAMGIKGTEATKEAADVVLADDNFATIERAVEEGRRIYDNVRKSVLFLLPTNGAQALVMLVAVVLGTTLPLEPVQVLWINMVTAVTLSFALAYEHAEPDIMNRPPRDPHASVVDRAYGLRIGVVSVLIGGATLAVFTTTYEAGVPLAEARTAAVTMLALGQLAYLFNSRYLDRSSLTPAVLRGNRVLWLMSLVMVLAQVGFVYLPFMNSWFGSAPVGLGVWGYTAGLAVAVFLLVEVGKAVDRRRGAHGVIGA